MAKSKAKRQEEEAQRAKEKAEHWILAFNPWFLRHQRRPPSFDGGDLRDISLWLQIIFGPNKVQAVQHKSRHNYVIAKVDLGVDIELKLGRHDWARFLNPATDYQRREHSLVFEYNFIKYGDQSDKQWEEYYPLSRPPPHNFPVLRDYPAPAWCERPRLGSGMDSDWCMPLKHLSPRPDLPAGPSSRPEAISEPLPAAFASPVPLDPRSSRPPQFGERHSGLAPNTPTDRPTPTRDPRIRHPAPLGTHHVAAPAPAPAPAPTGFIPYEPPAHYHPGLPTVAVKREPSPIRVPYVRIVQEEEEKKVKLELPPTDVSHKESKDLPGPAPGEGVLPKAEDNSSLELLYPSESDDPHPDADIKVESAPSTRGPLQMQLTLEGESASMQFVRIENPFGVHFLPEEPPQVSTLLWNWLTLIADGALALYYSKVRCLERDKESIIARLKGGVDLKGVTGRHEWHQCLRDCPPDMNSKITTVALCLIDPEVVVYERIDAPELTEDYTQFSVPYPPPLPLLKNEDDKKEVKVNTKKRQVDGDDIDDNRLRKRIKQEET